MKNLYFFWAAVILGFLLQVFSSYLSVQAFLNGDWVGGTVFFSLVLLFGFGIVILIVRSRPKKGRRDSTLQGPPDGGP